MCDDVSVKISTIAITGKSAIVIKPIFQDDNLLNSLTPKPLKNNKAKLHIEIPSIAVLTTGNNGESYCFRLVRKKVGSTIDAKPEIAANK